MQEQKNKEVPFHKYERHYSLLLSRLFPAEFKTKQTYKKARPAHAFDLTPNNRETLRKYRVSLENEAKSLPRTKRLLELSATLAEMLGKDLQTANRADMEELVSNLPPELAQKEFFDRTDVETILGCGSTVARKQIRKWIQNGWIKRIGDENAPDVHYRVKKTN